MTVSPPRFTEPDPADHPECHRPGRGPYSDDVPQAAGRRDDESTLAVLRRDVPAMWSALWTREPRVPQERRRRQLRFWIGAPIGFVLPVAHLVAQIRFHDAGHHFPGSPWIVLWLPPLLALVTVFAWRTRAFALACLVGWSLMLVTLLLAAPLTPCCG